jgi:WD40-like Beta Propeller Repeat
MASLTELAGDLAMKCADEPGRARPRKGRAVVGGLALALALASAATAQEVQARAGNIYYGTPGNWRQITSSGTDSDASLSPDGTRIIFVRRTNIPADSEEPREPHPVRTQLWTVGTRPSSEPTLVYGGVVRAWKFTYVTFFRPMLGPGSQRAYFLIALSATTDALVGLDVLEGRAAVIDESVLYYDVVGSGRYEGDLVVLEKAYLPEGISQLYWLISPEGRKLGFVGASEEDAREFLRNRARETKPTSQR